VYVRRNRNEVAIEMPKASIEVLDVDRAFKIALGILQIIQGISEEYDNRGS